MNRKTEPEAPVLLVTFNRPENTRKVFEKIREAKVKKLYIANDGPRDGNVEDIKAREEIKKMVDEVDWDCELHTNFQEKNLGCGWGPATAISWALENEDRVIILEDDCVPSIPFFEYCNYILEKYKDDTRVWLVSGRSHQQGSKFFQNKDYIFTHYGHSWGWATWKRCWQHFDMYMKDFPEFIEDGGALNVLPTEKQGKLYNKVMQRCYKDKKLHTHAWDYQFGYAILKNAGLCIVPAKNLIHNIGIIGTHSNQESGFHKLKAAEAYKIKNEPKFVLINKEYEELHFNTHIRRIFGDIPKHKRILRKMRKIGRRLWRK